MGVPTHVVVAVKAGIIDAVEPFTDEEAAQDRKAALLRTYNPAEDDVGVFEIVPDHRVKQVFSIQHETPVTATCCQTETGVTYWLAATEETARQELVNRGEEGEEPHGLCPHCLAELLAGGDYELMNGGGDA